MRVHQPDRAAAQCRCLILILARAFRRCRRKKRARFPSLRPCVLPLATCHFPRALPAPWLGWRDRPFADGSAWVCAHCTLHTARCTLLLVSSHRRYVFWILSSLFCVGLLCSMFWILCSVCYIPLLLLLVHFRAYIHTLRFPPRASFVRISNLRIHALLPAISAPFSPTGDTIRIPRTPIRDAQRTSSSFAAAPRES